MCKEAAGPCGEMQPRGLPAKVGKGRQGGLCSSLPAQSQEASGIVSHLNGRLRACACLAVLCSWVTLPGPPPFLLKGWV